jgi:hypothetical protein
MVMDRLLKNNNQMEVKAKNKEQNKKIVYKHIKDQDTVIKLMDNKQNMLNVNTAKIPLKKIKRVNSVIEKCDEK